MHGDREAKPCEEVDLHINDYGWLRPELTAPPKEDHSLELCGLLPKTLPQHLATLQQRHHGVVAMRAWLELEEQQPYLALQAAQHFQLKARAPEAAANRWHARAAARST